MSYLLQTYKYGKMELWIDYRQFHTLIVTLMPPDQSPNYFTVGKIAITRFVEQKPFTIQS